MLLSSVALLVVLAQAPAVPQRRAATPSLVTADERKAAEQIRPELLRSHIRLLASDLLEGRGPGSRGDGLAQAYIASQLEALGLEPAAPGGGFFQRFEIIALRPQVEGPVRVKVGTSALALVPGDEVVLFPGVQQPQVNVSAAEIVFVGYGIVAPEYEWDDYKGQDLRGKVLLMMNNDPADDPKLFAGKTRLYYGRWDYKYDQAARHGAAAAIIIHTTPSAGYPWQVVKSSWGGEKYELPDEAGSRLSLKSWVTEDVARRIASLGGKDLDALRKAAERRDFQPVSLGVQFEAGVRTQLERKQTGNVLARLPGSDPEVADEAVVLTAHHDHLGLREGTGDTIYNGAIDNASGTALMLAIARAAATLPKAPRRSLIFAAVGAEEQGLLGSQYLAAHLPLPSGRVAANVNIDGINVHGRTRDVEAIGYGKSSLDDYLRALAQMQQRVVVPDQFPDRGSFYRSDQFNFARLGIPAVYASSGIDVIGKPAGWGQQQVERFESTDYHQPSDEFHEDWNYEGALEDGRLLFYLSLKIANAQKKPAWKPGDEFEAARKKALQEIGE